MTRFASLFVIVCLFGAAPATAGGTPDAADPLVGADGTLRLDTGYHGSIDLRAWRFAPLPDGTPRFLRRDDNDPWFGSIGQPGVQVFSGGAGSVQAAYLTADGRLYIAGLFNKLDGTDSTSGFAMWDGSTWTEFGNASASGVFEMLVAPNGDVYVSGIFSFIATFSGVVAANAIAKWDGSAWSPLGNGLTGGPGFSSAEALAMDADGHLYVGGLFGMAGTTPADNVAMWDGSVWQPVGDGLPGRVGHLEFGPDDYLYAGGTFTEDGTEAGAKKQIARYNGTAWEPMDQGLNGEVMDVAFGEDGTVYAGGAFKFIIRFGTTPDPANHVAKWNGTTWEPVGEGVEDDVLALAFINGALYAGGRFVNTASGAAVNYIARWDGTAWVSLGDGVTLVNPPAADTPPSVRRLFTQGDSLVVVGEFDRAGDAAFNAVAIWDAPLATGTSVEREVPENAFRLDATYPNPFADEVAVTATLQRPAHVRLTVYDLQGRAVAVLVDEPRAAGSLQARWTPLALPGGAYFVRLDVDGHQVAGRMVTHVR